MSRPSASSTTTRSTRSTQTSTRCSTTTKVAPVRIEHACDARRAPRATPAGSRFAVGSSRSSRPGRIARAPARARRCFCPPESAEVGCGRAAGRARRRRAPRRRARQISSRGTPRFSQPNATSSPTRARITWESGSCSTRPARPRAAPAAAPVDEERPRCSPSSSPPCTPARRVQQRRLARPRRRRAAAPAPPAR